MAASMRMRHCRSKHRYLVPSLIPEPKLTGCNNWCMLFDEQTRAPLSQDAGSNLHSRCCHLVAFFSLQLLDLMCQQRAPPTAFYMTLEEFDLLPSSNYAWRVNAAIVWSYNVMKQTKAVPRQRWNLIAPSVCGETSSNHAKLQGRYCYHCCCC